MIIETFPGFIHVIKLSEIIIVKNMFSAFFHVSQNINRQYFSWKAHGPFNVGVIPTRTSLKVQNDNCI